MNSAFFYTRLALQNLRNNKQHYVPYMLTCIGTIMMFYIMCALAYGDMTTRQFELGMSLAKELIRLGTWVVALFAVIFLFYTHSFLLKRRKKEFALYNILGMGKRHIARVLLYETCYVAVATFALGMAGGILLSKLMSLLLLKLLNAQPVMGFEVPLRAVSSTITVFGGVFLLTYLTTLRHIHLASPAELLRGSRAGEIEPKSNWLIAVLGLITLAGGYYIAIVTQQPLSALLLFFVAVILVVVGTYCLFVAGSVTGLKQLKRNKRFYYQTRHFVPVSGMIYRMKQNAAGLASVCILSTMVLVMLSATSSLYLGIGDAVRSAYPRDIIISMNDGSTAALEYIARESRAVLSAQGIPFEGEVGYRYATFPMEQTPDGMDMAPLENSGIAAGRLVCVPFDDVAGLLPGVGAPKPGELLIVAGDSKTPQIPGTLQIAGERFSVAGRPSAETLTSRYSTTYGCYRYYALVPDEETFERLREVRRSAFAGNPSASSQFAFDVDLNAEEEAALIDALAARMPDAQVDGATAFYVDALGLYGGLFFLGLCLGTLFIMATVLIIYYKQISEGYDDRVRFEIMRNVGMSRLEIRQAISSQVLMVFFLPLVMAAIHMAFAFPMITRILDMLSMSNTALFAASTACALLAFAALYAVVYALTARVYYRIVAPAG